MSFGDASKVCDRNARQFHYYSLAVVCGQAYCLWEEPRPGLALYASGSLRHLNAAALKSLEKFRVTSCVVRQDVCPTYVEVPREVPRYAEQPYLVCSADARSPALNQL